MSGHRPSRPPVGNDVVDLSDPRLVGKGSDERFLRRVLAARERDELRGADDPDLALWVRWAAKEAAYKAVTSLRGDPPVFAHAGFVVEHGGPGGGSVRWEGLELGWRIAGGREEGALHAVAWCADDPGGLRLEGGVERMSARPETPLEELLGRFTERERRAVHSRASALVRLAARAHLARLLDREERGLEIVCAEGPAGRVPPAALVDGRPSRWTVSLSHHGDFLAWVLARWSEAEGSAGPPEAPSVRSG